MEQKKARAEATARLALGAAIALGLVATVAAIVALAAMARDGSLSRRDIAPATRAWIDARSGLRVLAVDGYEGAATELVRWMAADLGFRLELRSATTEEVARELSAGRADAIVGPVPRGEDALRSLIEPALETAADRLAYPIGEAMPRSLIDNGIERARRAGTLGVIYDKWGDSSLAISEQAGTSRDERLIALALAQAALSLALVLGLWLRVRPWRPNGTEPTRNLTGALESLAADNARLGEENARLRVDLEERSRLEEAKRRIDAAAAARRVEELTRCVIAKALDETAEARRGGENA